MPDKDGYGRIRARVDFARRWSRIGATRAAKNVRASEAGSAPQPMPRGTAEVVAGLRALAEEFEERARACRTTADLLERPTGGPTE